MQLTAEEAFHKHVRPFIDSLDSEAGKMKSADAVVFLKGVAADIDVEIETLIDNFEEDEEDD